MSVPLLISFVAGAVIFFGLQATIIKVLGIKPISFDTSGSRRQSKKAVMHKVEVIMPEMRFADFKNEMRKIGVTGMTFFECLGCGTQQGTLEYMPETLKETRLRPKIQVNIIVSKVPVDKVVEAAKKVLYTGHIGDGKIFVYDVERVVRVRTGEEDYAALQAEEE